MGPNNERDPEPFVSKWSLQSRWEMRFKRAQVEKNRKCLGANYLYFYCFLSGKRDSWLALTFKLFTTFSQIIHPFQDFRIRSLVTMRRLWKKGKCEWNRGSEREKRRIKIFGQPRHIGIVQKHIKLGEKFMYDNSSWVCSKKQSKYSWPPPHFCTLHGHCS